MEKILNQILAVVQAFYQMVADEIKRDKYLEVLRAVGVTNPQVLASERAVLRGWFISNANSSARYLKIYDDNQPFILGQQTPRITIYIPGSGGANLSIDEGILFTRGIVVASTTGAGDTDATAASAGETVVNLWVK